MMNVSWFKNQDHVAYCREEEIVPRLSRELGISDLAERVAAFRRAPTGGGEPEGAQAHHPQADGAQPDL